MSKVETGYASSCYSNFYDGVPTEPAEKRLQEADDGLMNKNIPPRKQSTIIYSSDPSGVTVNLYKLLMV